jgi:peptide/nickel transport system substrate-binding protein
MLLAVVAGCADDTAEEPTTIVSPAPTSTITPDAVTDPSSETVEDVFFITVATDAPSRFGDFEDIDEFGNVVGFDAGVIADIAAEAGFEYEFVVTSYDGLLDSVSIGEFDTAMSALVIPEQPQEGLVYTTPYLEVGQVLVVRANETVLLSAAAIGPGIPIGVQVFSSGEQTAREMLNLAEPQLALFDSIPEAMQALIDGEVDGLIIDSDNAGHYSGSYPQQLTIAGGADREAWISNKAYGIAVAAGNEELVDLLNQGIARAYEGGTMERLTQTWLIDDETISAGESLVGTPENELVIGIAAELTSMDPATRDPDLVSWEVKMNTMGGLLMYDAENNLIPILAQDFPEISEDKLEYTFRLRPGLTFPDGSELAAEDVKFSIDRAAGNGNIQINGYLKDANGDGFADADALQIIDPFTVKFVLKEPTAYFPSLLATPPYSVISQNCTPENFDPAGNCGSIGVYSIIQWEPGVQMRLKANPQWPGQAPAFENIQLRFYDDPGRMRRSLENSAIDVAWTGLSFDTLRELQGNPELTSWEGPSTFKSYLVFEQSSPPWDNARVREAVAHAIDRVALARDVFDDGRTALFSPVPDDTPGHVATEPARDLNTTQAILLAAGYSSENKLEMSLWFVNDNRYTSREEQYANALKAQLEETGLIAVTVEGAPWNVFRPESLNCSYPAYLLGWPSQGQPTSFLDAMSWMEYFITNTELVCSNYESQAMTALYEEALSETDEVARLELYRQIQELWAREFPTLDLTQEPRIAISLPGINNVAIDAMGLLHYDALSKTEAGDGQQ